MNTPYTLLSKIWRTIPIGIVEAVPVLKAIRRHIARRLAEHAQLADQQNQTAAAIALLWEAARLEPRNPGFRIGLGRLYFNVKALREARDCFDEALTIDFHCADAWKGLAFTRHEAGDINEAIYCYLKYLEEYPDDPGVHANLIEALASIAKYEDAIAAATRASDLFPKLAGFPFLAGRCHFDMGNIKMAMANLVRAAELDPSSADIPDLMGQVLATSGDTGEALNQFHRSIALDPDNGSAFLNMARLYNKIGRDKEYLDAAQNARDRYHHLGDRVGMAYAYLDEGWAHYKLRQWEESIKASELALDADGSMATARFNLALALLRIRDAARSKDEYRRAVALGDIGSLKSDGIDDLQEALRDDPKLPFGQEILNELRKEYIARTSHRTKAPGAARI